MMRSRRREGHVVAAGAVADTGRIPGRECRSQVGLVVVVRGKGRSRMAKMDDQRVSTGYNLTLKS